MKRLTFYFFILVLSTATSALLASPNLLGKVGLLIYKYHYLRTFPKTLVTVLTVTAVVLILCEILFWLASTYKIRKGSAMFWSIILLFAAIALTFKVAIDFTSWSYGHTGLRFRIGVHLLPVTLVLIFFNGVLRIKQIPRKNPLNSNR